MGTEVQFKSFFPRYYSGRDINEDSNGCNWPLYYTDQTSPNGHLSNSFQWVTAAAVDASLDYEKFALKRKMLEHEAVFKKQVHELHRLYRIQKDLMDEIKRKDLAPYHAFVASNTPQAYPFNGFSRPSKIRKEKFDLRVPAVVYIDLEESGENEAKDGFDLNQPAQMDDTASSEFVHPRSSSFFESMARAHQGSSNKGTNDPLGFKERLGVASQPKHNVPNKIHEIPHLSNDHQFIADRTRLLPTCGAESSKHWDSGVASHGSKHQIAASYDREKSSFWLFENQSILRRSGAEKTEQTGSPKSLKNAVIDINLPCDDLVTEEAPSTKKSTVKCDFDLNSCIDEDDTYDVAVDGRTMGVEEIDLEAPAFADTEGGSVCLEDTAAAEAIVAMSSSTAVEAEEVLLSPDSLNWFVNIALSDRKKKMDYFESMTLKLTEMDEEEHLPKAFEVEDDEVGPTPTNTGRAQRGQRRRGRQQKRDFQRDILPGLTSLSRQEVAEDLQAFGGLMRATGHVWGSSSRKGSSRGRRRTIARPAAVGPTETTTADVVRLEEGSLMGWGKTRRPRQQRCPAGNVRSTSMNGSSSLLACGSGCL